MADNVGKLTNACLAGDISKAKLILNTGTSVNSPNPRGFPPLFCAAGAGQTAVVELLLQSHGADVDVTGPQGATALYIAAQDGHSQVVELLLKNHASVDQAMATGNTPLFIASQTGRIDIVELLIQHSASVNQNGTKDGATPLFIAAQKGHLSVMTVLLAHGASVHKTMTDGTTPLYIAAQYGQLSVMTALLAHGASVHQARNDGITPLFIAAQFGHLNVVSVLLAHGSTAIKCGALGTPLDIARRQGHSAVVEVLVQHEASLNQKKIPENKKDKKVQVQEKNVKSKTAPDNKRDNKEKKVPLPLNEKTKEVKAPLRSKVSNTKQNEGEEKKGSIIDFSQVKKEVLDITVKKVAELKLPTKYRNLEELLADINNEGKEMAVAAGGVGVEADKGLSNKHLLKIATKIGPKWTLFAGFLNIGLRQVREIQREHRDDHTMAAWEMLSVWAEHTQGQTLAVRRQQLRDAAGEIDRQDLWQLI